MSSHHIVREKQEPALYLQDFEGFNEEYLGQLLEWSPTVLVSAQSYEKAISLGLKVDVVIGNDEKLDVQEHTQFVFSPYDNLPTVVKYLVSEKYPAVNIISQEDHFDDLADLLPEINIVLYTATTKSYAVKSGFRIWKPAGTIFKIDIIAYLETANLKPLENGDFEVINDGFVSFEFTIPYLFLSEYL
ncbi:MAG: thiamine pyrophosphokinase [Pedobacter sp.]|nr:thiamine pyrophosphokinase [Pedobacter sp.]MDQ8052654.1 thiamine pyrophosphokinase [Pedobacter sp.]